MTARAFSAKRATFKEDITALSGLPAGGMMQIDRASDIMSNTGIHVGVNIVFTMYAKTTSQANAVAKTLNGPSFSTTVGMKLVMDGALVYVSSFFVISN
jgi:hypothetical protein